jgi:hypothetical protein
MPQLCASVPDTVLQELLHILAPLKIERNAPGLVFEYFMRSVRGGLRAKGRRIFHAGFIREADRRGDLGLASGRNGSKPLA